MGLSWLTAQWTFAFQIGAAPLLVPMCQRTCLWWEAWLLTSGNPSSVPVSFGPVLIDICLHFQKPLNSKGLCEPSPPTPCISADTAILRCLIPHWSHKGTSRDQPLTGDTQHLAGFCPDSIINKDVTNRENDFRASAFKLLLVNICTVVTFVFFCKGEICRACERDTGQ